MDTEFDRKYSERWLREYAGRMNCYEAPDDAFDMLIEGLTTGKLFAHGRNLHSFDELDKADELKRHAEIYLRTVIDYSKFSFSCSC